MNCKNLSEFSVEQLVGILAQTAGEHNFVPENFKVEIHGYCENCKESNKIDIGDGIPKSENITDMNPGE